jgi:FAD/FMN-containing dehydrogenase
LSASALPQRLRALLGAEAVLSEPADCAPFLSDHRHLYQGRAAAIVQPRSVAQISALLAFCNGERIGVVPHGGNTSYCGGATPDESGNQVVLSLRHLNRIRSVTPDNYSLIAEAGCLLADVQQAAEAVERFLPLLLGSQGSCQIGGNLSTNAGGLNVLRYGMTRELVLGLEVVLPDGRLLETLSGLRKDNTGYDIRALFLGAEGTLGVITAASLKLFPQIRSTATAFVAVPDVQAAVTLLARLRAASGDCVSSFELLPRVALELAVRYVAQVSDPLPGHTYPWYVLIELSSARAAEPLNELLENALGAALEAGLVQNAVLAGSERERNALWRLREQVPEAQSRAGASLKHDVSLPITALPQFVGRAGEWLAAHVPEGVLVAYGHVGDGNLHFNLTQAAGAERAAFLARAETVRRALHDLVAELGGSFSAEHGIGRLKVGELERYAPAVELELMRAVKHAFDPNGIMNPGKVLRAEAPRSDG